MEIMDGVHLHLLLLLVTLIQGIQGQATVTPSSVVIADGDDVSLKCITTTTRDPFTFNWVHVSSTGTVPVYAGGIKQTANDEYLNFDVDEDIPGKRSTLIIENITRQDAGEYQCTATGQSNIPPATVTVEVGSVPEQMALIVIGSNSNYTYQATREAIGSSPEETITWILDGVTRTDGIVETDPGISDDSLFDKRSVFTFLSTPEIYNVALECNIGGHQVAKLNTQETRLVNIHKPPQSESGVIMIDITLNGTELTISCDDTDSTAVPAMSTFNIYSGGELITKPESDKAVTITDPEGSTEFKCVGSNYLGTTTTTKTYGSTTAPPTTGVSTTQTPTPDTGVTSITTTTTEQPPEPSAKVAAIAGGVVGAIVVIVIIVIAVCYCKKEERFCFEAGGTKSSGSSKPAGSAVGSSNGSERDVESPLNGVKDVTAEEKTKPEAAPRGHGSIQHTNDNPNQDMYAMVDKKPSGGRGGDAPDRGSGPGQNEPQGMLYADLDLSHKAGHTDKHVPKNENDVVVYSSILV